MDVSVNLAEMSDVQITEEFGNQSYDGYVHIRFEGEAAALDLDLSFTQCDALYRLLSPYFTPVPSTNG